MGCFLTLASRVERCIRVVPVPACGFVKRAVDIVHELAHRQRRMRIALSIPQDGPGASIIFVNARGAMARFAILVRVS